MIHLGKNPFCGPTVEHFSRCFDAPPLFYEQVPGLQLLLFKGHNMLKGEYNGVVVEHQTPNQEVLGFIPTDWIVLCP